jgi:putative spermidine/putrescine transport system ATP-binding protein
MVGITRHGDGRLTMDVPLLPALTERHRERSGAAILLDRISKHYGPVAAVAEVTLTIERGEFITFLGPSGSGKTTCLMMLAGFEQPDHGEIYIDDQPVVRIPPYRRNIGMVFQNYALFPHMSVADNIGFPLRQRGLDRATIRQRVGEALELVRMLGYENRYPRQLSGGQQQRVAIARAVIFRPRVLLMDEPLSALDKKLREEMQYEIKGLHERLGITFIYVTHDQHEALVMSDRIVVMSEGRIAQVGTPSDIYDRPASRFVAGFVGESNFLDATSVGAEAAGVVRLRHGEAMLRAAGSASAGACTIMVRPEKITIRTHPADDDTAFNTLPATVRQVTFVGEMRRYLLQTDSGAPIVVKVQHRFGASDHAPGERVLLTWAVADTLLV